MERLTGSSSFEPVASVSSVVRAARTFRLDPRPLENGEAISAFYREFYTGLRAQANPAAGHPEGGISRFWRGVRQVPDLARPGGTVVDIGCGNRRLCGDLQRAGWARVTGIEVSLARLESATRTYPDLAFYGSLDAASIAAGSVELIVMDNVIEHLLEPAVTVQRVRSWLQPAGRLVVITPSMLSGPFRVLGRRWTPELAPDQHIFLFTPPALARLLSAVGLHVEAQGSFHLPRYSSACVTQSRGARGRQASGVAARTGARRDLGPE